MSFQMVYNNGLSEVTVSNLFDKENDDAGLLFEDWIKKYKYIFLYVYRSNDITHLDLASLLEHFLRKRKRLNSGKEKGPSKIKQLFSFKKEKKTTKVHEVGILVINLDNHFDSYIVSEDQKEIWFKLNVVSPLLTGTLLRSIHYNRIPSAVLIESDHLQIITYEGKRCLLEDEDSLAFPWHDETITNLFCGSKLLHKIQSPEGVKQIEEIEFTQIQKKVKALIFGAIWAPPCRALIKQLLPIYQKYKQNDLNIEFIFCSTDSKEESFNTFYETMPWLAFTFDKIKLANLSKTLSISDIPSIVLIDEKDQVMTKHGRSVILFDKDGSHFGEWKGCELYELNEGTAPRITDGLSLILFTDGEPEDVEFSREVLKSIGKECFEEGASSQLGSSKSVASLITLQQKIQVFYTGSDQICDQIMENLGLGEAELPLIAIIDVLSGYLAICEEPDVSEEIISKFVSDFKNEKVKLTPIPPSNSQKSNKSNGVKIKLIEQALETTIMKDTTVVKD
uniref:Thioredoxin-like_fold domain-containing protein n=1 Tax=Rhabditophanes sp. KR3021 TaxID=114890 RepID=A0AC35UBD7_9BILA